MSTVLQDVRYALRQMRRSPGFTAVAIITLALGIGANVAIFTLVHGILMSSLPVADPAQLYRIGDTDNCCVNGGFVSDKGDFDIFSYDLFKHLRDSAPEFEQLAAVQAGQWQWNVHRSGQVAKEMRGEFVSGNYFSMLGLGPSMGRVLSPADDQDNATPVIVLSYATWKNEFAGDPSVIGQTISLQSRPFTIVGVAPAGFYGDRVSTSPPDLWMPLSDEPYVRGGGTVLHNPDANWLYAMGRVRPGTDIAALQAKLSNALRNFLYTRPAYTENGGSSIIPKQHVVIVKASGGIQNMQQETGTGLKMLMILSSVVLLIACANIANLLLARSMARREEVAIRVAMGAGRTRVMRQTITESVLLGLIGGIVGIGVAYAGAHTILAVAFPEARALTFSATPSPQVLGFALVVSLLTGVLFGIAPAWLQSHAQPAEVLKGTTRTTKDHSGISQKALVIFQAALSVVLIASAILMSKSLGALEHQNFGIETANRYVVHFDPEGAGYTADRLPELYREIESRYSALPGVENVSLAMYSPLEGDNWGECVQRQGYPAPGPNDRCGSTWVRVSWKFLRSMGVPMVRGRDFSEQDTATSQPVALVNEAFVKRFYPNQDPIGKHFGIGDMKYAGLWEIVGVFRDFKMNNPRDEVRPVFLRAMPQVYSGFKEKGLVGMENSSQFAHALIVQYSAPQHGAEQMLRRTMASIDPSLTVVDVRPYAEQVAGNFNQERLLAHLSSLFGILALILASVGLYGVMSYFVARRTSEIGIRMALGATRWNVVSLVMRGVGLQVALGLLIGIPSALFAGHLMANQLYGVSGYDPLAFVGSTWVLAGCATFAAFIPARRAASVDPMKALRAE